MRVPRLPPRHHAVAAAVAPLRNMLLSSALASSLLFGVPTPVPAIDMSTTLSSLQTQEKTVANLFDSATPSVVYITTFVERTDRLTMNAVEVPAGTGSGFVWDDEGHVVTNYHVIRGARGAKVALVGRDGRTTKYDASLVGFNPDKDDAVLQIDAGRRSDQVKPISIGESKGLRVGQTTLAIGNPFGLDHTLTVGVVSGLGREVTSPTGRPITNVIQTDAAINPGNSGGALLDSAGRLIGMNTAIFSPSGASAGIGFAIPVDTLKYQVATIIKYGKVERPALGISYMAAGQARALGVSRGVLVLDVPKGSEASRSGLLGTYRRDDGEVVLGDVIVGVNNDRVDTDLDLFRAIDKCAPGEAVRLTVSRLRDVDGRGKLSEVEASLTLKLQATDATA